MIPMEAACARLHVTVTVLYLSYVIMDLKTGLVSSQAGREKKSNHLHLEQWRHACIARAACHSPACVW